MSESVVLKRLLSAVVVLVAVVDAAVVAGGARADTTPPVVSVGPVSDPNNTVTGSGTASSAGQTDTCVNGQHSGTAPQSPDANGVRVNDRACQTNTSTSADSAQSANSSPTSSGNRTTSSSTGNSRAGTASAKRARSASATVAASQALGLRITRIRYLTTAVQATKRLQVLVTVRDLRGQRVRDAIVSIRRVPGAKLTITSTQATYSNRLGQASFVVPVPKQTLGKRLLLLIAARTPKAHALAFGSVRLPSVTTAPA
jgi:hypothetical protein